MQQRHLIAKCLLPVLFFIGVFFSATCLAKEINLYDQPQDKAKVVGTVDLATGIIPIFTPKNGDWMKVGDPRNGNVGWIKSSDLNNGGGATFTFSQRIMNDGKGPHTYQIMEYGKPQNLTGEQMQTMIQKMQNQQKNVQQDMQKAVQNMVNQINSLYHQTWGSTGGTPVIMPIVILPAQQKAPTTEQSTKK